MADLVTLADFKTYLGVTGSADDALLTQILDDTEAHFEAQCNRTDAPFLAAQTGRVDHLRATGGCVLFLPYAVTSVTSLVLGFDSAVPVETLAVNDKKVLVWLAGSPQITRVDGGIFGCFGWPLYVHITYNAAADLPVDASLAVMTAAAAVYRRRQNAESAVKSETAGPYSVTYYDIAQSAALSSTWSNAVAAHWRAPL